MKYVLSILSIIIGVAVNFLAFTQVGLDFMQSYIPNVMFILISAIIAVIIALFNFIKNKERILSTIGIVINLVFIVYFLMLFAFVS